MLPLPATMASGPPTLSRVVRQSQGLRKMDFDHFFPVASKVLSIYELIGGGMERWMGKGRERGGSDKEMGKIISAVRSPIALNFNVLLIFVCACVYMRACAHLSVCMHAHVYACHSVHVEAGEQFVGAVSLF